MDDKDFIAAMSEGIPPIAPPIRGSQVDEYDPAPPCDDEIAEAYRLKYEDE